MGFLSQGIDKGMVVPYSGQVRERRGQEMTTTAKYEVRVENIYADGTVTRSHRSFETFDQADAYATEIKDAPRGFGGFSPIRITATIHDAR